MTMMIHPQLIEEPKILKVELGADSRFEILKRLRDANIHRGSLFPGLEGLSESLHISWLIDRDEARKDMEKPIEPPAIEADEPQEME
jgi:hypothetical protein